MLLLILEGGDNMEDIGTRIKRVRQNKRITQKELAAEMGISQTAIALWESGNRQLSLSALDEIAHYLDVSASYLMYGEADFSDEISKNGISIKLQDGNKYTFTIDELQRILKERQGRISYDDIERFIACSGKELSAEQKLNLIKLLVEDE